MWALSTGDYVVLARFARVPLGQGGASSLIIAFLGGLLLCGSFFGFGYIYFCWTVLADGPDTWLSAVICSRLGFG